MWQIINSVKLNGSFWTAAGVSVVALKKPHKFHRNQGGTSKDFVVEPMRNVIRLFRHCLVGLFSSLKPRQQQVISPSRECRSGYSSRSDYSGLLMNIFSCIHVPLIYTCTSFYVICYHHFNISSSVCWKLWLIPLADAAAAINPILLLLQIILKLKENFSQFFFLLATTTPLVSCARWGTQAPKRFPIQ